jgi:DNA topoisomerase I
VAKTKTTTAKSLVIVESPAKAKTINKFLGPKYVVKASMGHVRDLPVKSLAVDVDKDFAVKYEVVRGREKVLDDLKKAAKTAGAIFLAADPDREGEAICWHLAQVLKSAKKPIRRVMFNEITKRAVQEAFTQPGEIDQRKVDAQQARRILDRLVGYKISPLLWEKVRRGISAGRVQSVALRLVADREKEIRAFTATEYWSVTAELARPDGAGPAFPGRLARAHGEKIGLASQAETDRVLAELAAPGTRFRVAQLLRRERRRNPVPPFTTSKLQQEAARKLRFTARKTMQVAQQLYEGIELGEAGAVGLITYMRTDATRVAPEAQAEARQYIAQRYGAEFLPERPPVYKSGKGAQEAHEAIRPTSVLREPAQVAASLGRDQLALYTLIWNRFVASQMLPARFDTTTADIAAGPYTFRASGQHMTFAGFMQIYVEGRDDPQREETGKNGEAESDDDDEHRLPALEEGMLLDCRGITPAQHFTQPPPRYSEATLVKELEERGIGRPSTYAAILSVIQNRDYAVKAEGRFKPTELGEIVVDLLVESFPRILDPGFTAEMETTLDQIEEGQADWLKALHTFYAAFTGWLEQAKEKMKNIKAMEEPTDQLCEKCGRSMVIKWGRFGKFLACSGYPECKSTKELGGNGNGTAPAGAEGDGEGEAQVCENCGKPMVLKRGRFGPFLACSGYPECRTVVKVAQGPTPAPEPTDQVCEACGAPMVIRTGRFGRFYSCSTYPKCKTVKPIPLGIMCPKCGADLSARRTQRGRTFYGCTAYPACDFTTWDRPVPEACPTCGAPFLVEKRGKAGVTLRCLKDGCGYTRDASVPAVVAPTTTEPDTTTNDR